MSRPLRHLQQNTFRLNQPHEVIDFFLDQKIDIANLQEINVPIDNQDLFSNICHKAGLHYIQELSWFDVDHNQALGNGILSRHPIVDYQCTYYNGTNFGPKHITTNQLIGPMHDSEGQEIKIPGSRGIKYAIISSTILHALVQINHKLIRVINTHFPVSDNCTEIIPMYEMSQLIHSQITHSSNLPIIFAGDLNIRSSSYSVQLLSRVMDCHTQDITDTLSISHPVRSNDFPEGLAVDHVFSRGLSHIKTNTHQVDFSDHQALISDFTL